MAELGFALRVLGQRGICGEDLAGPPRAERVIEQEVHHVVLGEQLRDGRQLIGADLVLRLVDRFLLVGLPELIDPAEAVGGDKHLARQLVQHVLQLRARLRRERDFEHRVTLAENLGQHLLREAAGERQPVLALLAGEFAALVHCHRLPRLGLDQEIVLREIAGEEHPVPVLVGDLALQPGDGLRAPLRITGVTELLTVRAQPVAQTALRRVLHAAPRLMVSDRELFERLDGARLRDTARPLHGIFEVLAKFGSERGHGRNLP